MARRVPKPLLPVVVGVLAGVLALWAVSPSEAGMTQPGGPEGPAPTHTTQQPVQTTATVPATVTDPTSVPAAPAATTPATGPAATPTWNDDPFPPHNPKASPTTTTTPGGECPDCM